MTEVDIKLKDKKSHNTTTSCIVGISEVSGKYARSQTRSPGKLNKGIQSAFDPKHKAALNRLTRMVASVAEGHFEVCAIS